MTSVRSISRKQDAGAFCIDDFYRQGEKTVSVLFDSTAEVQVENEGKVAMPDHLRSIVDHDGVVILDIQSDQFFSINPTGTYIWQRLLKGESAAEIAAALAAETGTEETAVIADVHDFITELKRKHLFDLQT